MNSLKGCPNSWLDVGIVEGVRVILFIAAVASVYAACAIALLRRRRRGWRAPEPGSPEARWSRWIFLLAAFGLFCFAYGGLVEPYWLEVTTVRLASPKLPKGGRPVRIVLLSDLHCEGTMRLEERLPGVVGALKPDLIAFTGDALNSADGLPLFRRLMARLAAIAPTFAVKGNWDVWRWSRIGLYDGTGVRELDGEGVRVEAGGAPLWIAGAPAFDDGKAGKALASRPAGLFTVFLSHYPDLVMKASAAGADLCLSGHTHGGQVAMPFYGALVTFSEFGKRFERGLHRVGATALYVNRGIGMDAGLPRVRFLSRPEVTLLQIANQ